MHNHPPQLIYSNNINVLLEHLLAMIEANNDYCIIVPHNLIAEQIKQQCALRYGIAWGLQCLRLEKFIQNILIHKQYTLLGLQQYIELLSDFFIEQLQTTPPSILETTFSYFKNHDHGNHKRIHELSTILAELFLEYEYTRPEMLHAWANGKYKCEHSIFDHEEKAQAFIWHAIFNDHGLLSAYNKKSNTTWIRFGNILPHIDHHSTAIPGTILFFGLSNMSPLHFSLVNKLALTSNVSIFSINPCMEYWEDVINVYPTYRKKKHFKHRLPASGNLDLPIDSMDFLDQEDNLALQLWGKPGREQFILLNELSNCTFESCYIDPIHLGNTVLHKLQKDILLRKASLTKPQKIHSATDNSLVVTAHSSIHNEIEYILQSIYADIHQSRKSKRSYFLPDTCIIIPQTSKRLEYLTAILEMSRSYNIPMCIVDAPISLLNPLIHIILKLLQLPQTQLSRSDVWPILSSMYLHGAFAINRNSWSFIMGISGIYGDLEQEDTYYSWYSGLQRLSLSMFLPHQPDVPVASCEGHDYYPLVSSKHLDSLASFIHTVDSLLNAIQNIKETKTTLKHWLHIIEDFIKSFIRPTTTKEMRQWDTLWNQWHIQRQHTIAQQKVDYNFAISTCHQLLINPTSIKGSSVHESIYVGTFSSLRNLPTSISYICGLADKEFPRIPVHTILDLKQAKHKSGDITCRDEDLYLYLERLCTTSQKIHLSYVNIDHKTGDPLFPSHIINETKSIVLHDYGLAIEEQPHTATLVKPQLTDFPRHDSSATIAIPVPTELPLWLLHRYFESPLQASAQLCEITSYGEQDFSHTYRQQPAEEDRLFISQLLKQIITQLIADKSSPDVSSLLTYHLELGHKQGILPSYSIGQSIYDKYYAVIHTWLDKLNNTHLENLPELTNYYFGKAPYNHHKQSILEPITPGKSPCSLIGTIVNFDPTAQTHYIFSTKDTGATFKELHRTFINHCLLIASKIVPSTDFSIMYINQKPRIQTTYDFQAIPYQHCVQYLETVIQEFTSTIHDYYLPIEVVEKVLSSSHIQQQLQHAYEMEYQAQYQSSSNRFGPLYDLQRYPPPQNAQELIENKFSLYKTYYKGFTKT